MNVLRSHRVEIPNTNFYDISGLYTPLSIKDQVIRATTLIEEANDQKIFSEEKSLLVIGGGFTGMTAAIKAASKGIKTFVIEKDEQIFSKFRTIRRFVCPNQYDFPHKHWAEQKFPWQKSDYIKVDWEANTMTDMIQKFANKVSKTMKGNFLHIAVNTTCTVTTPKGKVNIQFNSQTADPVQFFPKVKTPHNFGMILSCLGVGPERVRVKGTNYESFPFWEFQANKFKALSLDTLICGAGDGGLQDFLLLATDKELARDIYSPIRNILSDEDRRNVEFGIMKAHDICERSNFYYGRISKKEKCKIERKIHYEIKNLVDMVYDKNSILITQVLSKMVTPTFTTNKMTLAYPCDHFTKCYPLNQFLILLLDKFKRIRREKSFLLNNTSIEKIEGVKPHQCNNDPYDCSGKEHNVTVNNATCEQIIPGPIPLPGKKPTLVLVRFGIEMGMVEANVKALFGTIPAGTGTQIMPYILP